MDEVTNPFIAQGYESRHPHVAINEIQLQLICSITTLDNTTANIMTSSDHTFVVLTQVLTSVWPRQPIIKFYGSEINQTIEA